ncbi:unnamed protein product [Fusarium venenatum]|uniref:Xylanolytic transcriptional activator regulatory domain-containing protein n=1 Tax=Fusarium venenatum TaxID=56646 RepID=A0A2L2SS67_9HYPO|nr:uncharacterized protein FVRRES_12632 [Fusarium venenatum]CEI39941.1 unnamed protein product [Fusarium venenatum]
MYQHLNGAYPSPYSPHHLETPSDVSLNDCIPGLQSQHILQVLPSKPTLDALIESFFSDINHHYSIINPSLFIQQYVDWSTKTEQEQYQDAQLTTLILMICACVTQQLPQGNATQLSESLSTDYHSAGQRLAMTTSAGLYSLTNLQWKVLSICWFQGEARFIEAWHTIGLAIQEAYELGFHQARPCTAESRTEAQIGRQIWRTLHCWNWQLSLTLGRPMIMNDIDSEPDVEVNLATVPPSPTLSTRLQYELVSSLSKRWHTPHRIDSPTEIRAHSQVVQTFLQSLPPVYRIDNTDTTNDQKWPWLITHRYYVQAMAYFIILQPYKAYLSNPSIDPMMPEVQKIQQEATQYSLNALNVARQWSSHALDGNVHFHLVVLCLFDTAAFLSTTLARDNMLQKGDAMAAIENATIALRQLGRTSQGAKTSHVLLCRILKGAADRAK